MKTQSRLAVSMNEAAEFLSLSRNTAFELRRQGKFRVIKVGARTLVPVSELQRFLDEELARQAGDAPAAGEGQS